MSTKAGQSLSIWLSYAVVAFIIYQIATSTRQKFQPGLHHLPGPSIASWTNLWRLYHAWRGDSHSIAIALHRRHGKLVRIGPNVVSVSDPAAVPVIYNTRGTFLKTAFYPMQSITWHKRPRPNIFSVRDEALHRQMKRRAAAAYTTDALLKMERSIDECGDVLVARLRKSADDGTKINLGAWLHYYAFDVVGTITFNERLGFLDSGTDVDGIITASGFMMQYFSCCGMIPILHKMLLGNPILPYLIPQIEAANHGTMFTLRALRRRTGTTSKDDIPFVEQPGDDMLSRWLRVGSREPEKMTMTDLVVALSTNIFAGSDTTAISLRATLYFLIKNPAKLRLLQQELDRAFEMGQVRNPISDQDAREHLPYLNATIKEALRLHPVVGLLLERHVPPEGIEIDGTLIPGGTIVGINPWVVQYDEEVFIDPERFEPERWLAGSNGKHDLARMERSFLLFGAGSRVCLGRNLSMIELRKILPRLLREFEFGLEHDETWQVQGGWFTPQKMPLCSVKRRIFE